MGKPSAKSKRYVALLRGINLGGRNRVPMAQLRDLCAAAGATNVRTYIASGNVVLDSRLPSAELRDAIQAGIQREFGISILVVLLTAHELAAVLTRNPFAERDTNVLHVAFSSDDIHADDVERLAGLRLEPEEVAIAGRQIYMYLPSEFGTGQMAKEVDRVKVKATVRNWRTVTALNEMAADRA